MFDDTAAQIHLNRVFPGALPGPLLAIEVPLPLISAVSQKFERLDSLRRMRGSLVLCAEGAPLDVPRPDAEMTLPQDTPDAKTAYFRCLGRMTALGMIQGRGVPNRWVA